MPMLSLSLNVPRNVIEILRIVLVPQYYNIMDERGLCIWQLHVLVLA